MSGGRGSGACLLSQTEFTGSFCARSSSKEGKMSGPKDTIQIKKREGVLPKKGGLHFVQCSQSYASMVNCNLKCRILQ